MRANTVERRMELLKLEGLGFSENDIVKQLSEKYKVTKRQIYYDFQTRHKWQLSPDAYKHYLKALNCLQQIYNRASLILLTNKENANAQIGALRIMTDIAIKQAELSGYKPQFVPSNIEIRWVNPFEIDYDSLTEEEKAILNQANRILSRHKIKKEEIH